MYSLKVVATGSNKFIGSRESTTTAEVQFESGELSLVLGDIIYSVESSGFNFWTHEVYVRAMQAIEGKDLPTKTVYQAILDEEFNGVQIKISYKKM